jgi:hypothetical protein
MAALVLSVTLGICGGLITGWLMVRFPAPKKPFDDSENWEVEAEEEEEGLAHHDNGEMDKRGPGAYDALATVSSPRVFGPVAV